MSGNKIISVTSVLTVAIMAALFVAMAVPDAQAKRRPKMIFGVSIPPGAKKIHEFRDSASYYVNLTPEGAAKLLISAAGGADRVNVFRSKVGYTIIIFVENKAREPFTSIQIAGLTGRTGCKIIFTRQRVVTGWHWQFFKKPKKRWDYR